MVLASPHWGTSDKAFHVFSFEAGAAVTSVASQRASKPLRQYDLAVFVIRPNWTVADLGFQFAMKNEPSLFRTLEFEGQPVRCIAPSNANIVVAPPELLAILNTQGWEAMRLTSLDNATPTSSVNQVSATTIHSYFS